MNPYIPDINAVWEEIKDKLSSKISSVAFIIYFSNLRPYTVRGDTLVLLAPLEAHRKSINSTYKKPLLDAMKATGCPFSDYIIVLKDEAESFSPIQEEPQPVEEPLSDSIPFTKEYTFDNFVIGDSNKLASMATLAVAENPGDIYNPLFIYSRPGLGKTHLLNAIGNFLHEKRPELKVMYITAENFTNDYIYSIRNSKNAEFIKFFNEKYRGQDVLMLDDVQFLEKAEKTQEALFHIFNDLYAKKKQIIISSDRPIRNLSFFDERLASRFASGITVDIVAPSFEDRVAILLKKNYSYKFEISEDVIYFLADLERSNIRILEGMLKTVGLYSRLNNKPAHSVEFAKEALHDSIVTTEERVTIESITTATSKYFNVKMDSLIGNRRTKDVVLPRQYAMYIITLLLPNTPLATIGEFFNRDYSTVISSRDKIGKLVETDEKTQIAVEDIKNMILNK